MKKSSQVPHSATAPLPVAAVPAPPVPAPVVAPAPVAAEARVDLGDVLSEVSVLLSLSAHLSAAPRACSRGQLRVEHVQLTRMACLRPRACEPSNLLGPCADSHSRRLQLKALRTEVAGVSTLWSTHRTL